jgi:hypothetical protein
MFDGKNVAYMTLCVCLVDQKFKISTTAGHSIFFTIHENLMDQIFHMKSCGNFKAFSNLNFFPYKILGRLQTTSRN